jgi:uncharacterized membrane protein YhaH (DUF805 family)
MLIEFDYNNDLTPSFPGIIAPLEELWISWLMKEVALKATYNAMLRGRLEGDATMQELTFDTLIAVFEEIFGRGLFWAMVAAAVLVTLGWIYVLIRDRSLGMRQFLVAQLFMPVGAVLAVWFVMAMTDSHLADIGGPVDVIVLLGIAAMGAVGGAILVYTVERLLFRRPGTRLAGEWAQRCTASKWGNLNIICQGSIEA